MMEVHVNPSLAVEVFLSSAVTLAIPAELCPGEEGRSGYDVMLLPLLGARPPAVL